MNINNFNAKYWAGKSLPDFLKHEKHSGSEDELKAVFAEMQPLKKESLVSKKISISNDEPLQPKGQDKSTGHTGPSK